MYSRGIEAKKLMHFSFDISTSFSQTVAKPICRYTYEQLLDPDFHAKLKSLNQIYGEVIFINPYWSTSFLNYIDESIINLAELLDVTIRIISVVGSEFKILSDYIEEIDNSDDPVESIWAIKNNLKFLRYLETTKTSLRAKTPKEASVVSYVIQPNLTVPGGKTVPLMYNSISDFVAISADELEYLITRE